MPGDEQRERGIIKGHKESFGGDGNVCYIDYEDRFIDVYVYVKIHQIALCKYIHASVIPQYSCKEKNKGKPHIQYYMILTYLK